MEYTLNRYFSFVPKSELSFNDARIFTVYKDGSKETKLISPLTVELSPHFTIGLSEKRTRPYFLIGPTLKIPIPDRSNPNASEINSTIGALDLGFGLNKELKFFSIAPELRYSYGLNNIANSPDINRMHFHNITLVLIFKG